MQSVYFDLLKQWCDELIEHQVKNMGPEFDGAFLCPACKVEHGRCQDAVYPFMYMADRTGDMKYVEAAKAVFDWHERNMYCDDGSVYNDANAEWRYITVFESIALCEALERHSSLLDGETRAKWENKLARMANWLYHELTEDAPTNINYTATNAAALALTGKYFDNEAYIAQAEHLAAYALEHITPNGLLYGEGKPRDVVTPRGCRAIDIGYNVEESIPSLVKYAVAVGDDAALDKLTDVLRKQLSFMLPDGAWDNSFGSRNNKWTYYGSRTSDGCQAGYALLADRDPAFAEASLRNALLMQACSKDGLLHGGLQYVEHGEPACVHHTFTHANALTCALDAGIEQYAERAALPEDAGYTPIRYFPELDTYKLAVGNLRATVTGYDYDLNAGHASGGTMTMLWHKTAGPVIAASVVDYKLVEYLNQQLPLKRDRHRPLVPRVELMSDGKRYSQCYDTRSVITTSGNNQQVSVKVHASLVAIDQTPIASPVCVKLEYRLTSDEVGISGRVYGRKCTDARFVLPVIGDMPRVDVHGKYTTKDVFFLTGGFGATEYTICPDADGRFAVTIALPQTEKAE